MSKPRKHLPRVGRCLPEEPRRPRRTCLSLAAQAVRHTRRANTTFGRLVGCGTAIVEAIYAGRRAIGANIHPRRVDLVMRNVDAHRRAHGQIRGQHAVETLVHNDILIFRLPDLPPWWYRR